MINPPPFAPPWRSPGAERCYGSRSTCLSLLSSLSLPLPFRSLPPLFLHALLALRNVRSLTDASDEVEDLFAEAGGVKTHMGLAGGFPRLDEELPIAAAFAGATTSMTADLSLSSLTSLATLPGFAPSDELQHLIFPELGDGLQLPAQDWEDGLHTAHEVLGVLRESSSMVGGASFASAVGSFAADGLFDQEDFFPRGGGFALDDLPAVMLPELEVPPEGQNVLAGSFNSLYAGSQPSSLAAQQGDGWDHDGALDDALLVDRPDGGGMPLPELRDVDAFPDLAGFELGTSATGSLAGSFAGSFGPQFDGSPAAPREWDLWRNPALRPVALPPVDGVPFESFLPSPADLADALTVPKLDDTLLFDMAMAVTSCKLFEKDTFLRWPASHAAKSHPTPPTSPDSLSPLRCRDHPPLPPPPDHLLSSIIA